MCLCFRVGECGCAAVPSLRVAMGGPAMDACCSIKTAEYWQDEQGKSTNGLQMSSEM